MTELCEKTFFFLSGRPFFLEQNADTKQLICHGPSNSYRSCYRTNFDKPGTCQAIAMMMDYLNSWMETMMGSNLDQVNMQSWNSRLMRNYSAIHRWESAEQTFPKTTSSGCSISAGRLYTMTSTSQHHF